MISTPTRYAGRREILGLAAGAVAVLVTPRRGFGGTLRRGGVLKHIGLEPGSFDIQATASPQTQLISSFVRRTLFKFVNGFGYGPSDFRLVPDLALAAEASRDGRIYTISLRRGVRWEQKPPVSGRALTAADVKYSLERALQRPPSAGTLGPVEGIETAGAHTVRVHLREAFAPFRHNLAEPCNAILPPEVEDKLGDFKSAQSLIGCGPFVLERYEPGVKAIFARNPSYYRRGLPYLDRVEWIFLKDRTTQLALFRAGEVDVPSHDATIPRSDTVSFKRSNPDYPLVYWEGLATRTLAMRTDRPPFNDVRVRRALSMSVDRHAWRSRDPDGQGFADPGPVPAPLKEWTLPTTELGEGAKYLEHDPARARRLLADAGFPNGLKVKCTHSQGQGPEYGDDLGLLAAHLKAVGVELQIVNEEHGSYVRGSLLGKFDETSWGPSPLLTEVDGHLYGFYRSGQPSNRSHVADPTLDVMLDAQRRATSTASRRKVIRDIQRHASAQVYYIYTPYPRNASSWTPWVKNYGPKNSFDRGAQLEVVWLDRA